MVTYSRPVPYNTYRTYINTNFFIRAINICKNERNKKEMIQTNISNESVYAKTKYKLMWVRCVHTEKEHTL